MIRKKNQLTLMSMLIGKCMLMRVLVLHTPMQPYHAAVTALSSSSSSNSGTSKARYSSRAGKPRKIAIIGGGASGMFASVNLSKACKESNLDQEVEVHVLEGKTLIPFVPFIPYCRLSLVICHLLPSANHSTRLSLCRAHTICNL